MKQVTKVDGIYTFYEFKKLETLALGQTVAVKSVNGDFDLGHDVNYDVVTVGKIGKGVVEGMYKLSNGCFYFADEIMPVVIESYVIAITPRSETNRFREYRKSFASKKAANAWFRLQQAKRALSRNSGASFSNNTIEVSKLY